MTFLIVPFCSHAGKPNFPQVLEKIGGDDETRTRDLCRDSLARCGFTITYKDAGTAKIPVSRIRHRIVWVGLWVGKKCQPSHRSTRPGVDRFGSIRGPVRIFPVMRRTRSWACRAVALWQNVLVNSQSSEVKRCISML